MADTIAGPSSLAEHSLNRQVVLEEEEYTEALSQIIARDFFPSLVHLDATNEYLDAIRTRDPHLINASVRRLEEINFTPAASRKRRAVSQTPSQTPFDLIADTPLQSTYGELPQKHIKYDTDMSLDEFQARYTSEDNSSFTKILDKENRLRKEKWGWAWNAQNSVEAQQEKMLEQRRTMLIEPPTYVGVPGKFRIEAPKPAGLIEDTKEDAETDDGSKEKLIVCVEGSEVELPADVMAPLKDKRVACVDGWRFKTRNSLMFNPDADICPYHPSPSSATTEINPKKVVHSNTRISEYEHVSGGPGSVSAPPSPARSRIDAAITGTPYYPRSPKERGFSLVPNLPSPTPAELGPTALKQLMTWGTLNSTPRIIGDIGDPATPFRLPDISAREVMSRRLADKASKSLRTKAEMFYPGKAGLRTTKTSLSSKKGNMGPPNVTPRRAEVVGNLTPAARRLLQRSTMGTAASRRAEAMELSAGWDSGAKGKERDLDRVRWTPTPTPVNRR